MTKSPVETNTPNNLQMFSNEEFGEIRTVTLNNKPYAVAIDVAKLLGYSNTRDAITRHCRGVVKTDVLTNSGVQTVSVIPEGDIYRLIIKSKLPTAEKFEVWVMEEVLPTINHTGGYVQDQREEEFINTYFPSFSEETKLAMVQDLRAKNEQLRTENEKLKIDNKALSTSILEWEDRAKLNAGIRRLALTTGKGFGEMWNVLYKNLKYKFHIDLRLRGKKMNEPYIATIKEEEWSKVIQTFSALCEELNQSPSEMINAA